MAKNLSTPFYFISYSHKDSATVVPVINHLTKKGYNIWFDSTSIPGGTEWQEEIGSAIFKCKGMIAFLSPSFIASRHCKREVSLADEFNKNILPIYIEETKLSNDLKYLLSGKQAVYKNNLNDRAFYTELLSLIGGSKAKSPATISASVPKLSDNKDKFNKAMAMISADKAITAYPVLKALSTAGFHEATCELADLHLMGKGAEKDLTKALQLHSLAADKKNVKSLIALGNIYLKGIGVKIDKLKAIDYFTRAAQLGDADIAFMLGSWHNNGENINRDLKKAFKFYTVAADLNHPEGLFYTAESYYNGKGVKKDLAKAYEFYSRGARLNNVDCQYMAGYCRYYAVGTTKDISSAIEYLTLASNKTSQRARLLLGIIYEEVGRPKEAFKCFSDSASLDNFEANLKLAYCYYNGIGTTQNYEESYAIYSKLSESDNPTAILMYCVSLFFGKGVNSDESKAISILTKLEKRSSSNDILYYLGLMYAHKASKKFNPVKAENYFLEAMRGKDKRAEFELAKLYFFGYIARVNYKRALELFRSSASKTVPEGYYYIGLCYYYALGVGQDFHQAFQNLITAQENGVTIGNNLIGVCYYYGLGVLKNYSKAYRLFFSEYKNGHKAAACNTAICLINANGVGKNVVKGVSILEANQRSSVECIFALAECYELGIGVGASKTRCEELYLLASEYDYPPALAKITDYHKNGGIIIKKSLMKSSKFSLQCKNSAYLAEAVSVNPDATKC